MVYASVKQYFEGTPHLADLALMLDNSSVFWESIRDNTRPTHVLVSDVEFAHRYDSAVYRAAHALLQARKQGHLPYPATE